MGVAYSSRVKKLMGIKDGNTSKKKVKVADVEVVRPDDSWSKDKIKTWLDDHGIKYHWNSGKETLLSKVK